MRPGRLEDALTIFLVWAEDVKPRLSHVPWRFEVEPGGLVRVDPGPLRHRLKEALDDCVESLSPRGQPPALSTYWIDRALSGLYPEAPREAVIGSGNAWSLVRHGDTITVRFDYSSEGETWSETIGVDDLAAGLTAYRDVVLQALRDGHQLDARSWAQKNPG